MKKLMQSIFAALLCAGMAITAPAQEADTQVTQKLGEKIAQEIKNEQAGDKPLSGAEFNKKLAEKMRAHLGEIRQGSTASCIRLYGDEKSGNCQCVTDKTDFEAAFALLEKYSTHSESEIQDDIRALEQKNEETYKACHLDYDMAKQASREAMKKMAPTEK